MGSRFWCTTAWGTRSLALTCVIDAIALAQTRSRTAPHEEAAGRALACGLAAGLLLSAGAAPREALAAPAVTTGGQGDLLEEYYARAAATGSASFLHRTGLWLTLHHLF